MNPKITIGIPTYNRLDLLKIMSSSLYKSDLSFSPNIRIYDDCSHDLNNDILSKIFPNAKSIKINNINMKADKNMYQMYADFISTDDDYFFNADSDLIFNNQWLINAFDMIKKTDGILSLFNTDSHRPYKIINDLFCLKKTLGAAGTFFTRERMLELLNDFDTIKKVSTFDWQWSKYFTDNNINLYCVNNSLVQHIGYSGQHANIQFDVGKGFKIETIEDGQIINDIYTSYISNVVENYKNIIIEYEKKENKLSYHIIKSIKMIAKLLIPDSFIKIIKRLIKHN